LSNSENAHYKRLRDVPPARYALPSDNDTRKFLHLQIARRNLAIQLYSYSDRDGTNIWVSGETLAAALGCSRRTILSLLADLRSLGFLTDEGYRGKRQHATRMRRLNLDVILGSQPEQRSQQPEQRSQQPEGVNIAHDLPAVDLPNKTSLPTAPKIGWREILFSNQVVMGAPTKSEMIELEKLLAAEPEYGAEYLKRGIRMCQNRRDGYGFTGLKISPWRVFLNENWFAQAKADRQGSHDWRYEHDAVYRERHDLFVELQCVYSSMKFEHLTVLDPTEKAYASGMAGIQQMRASLAELNRIKAREKEELAIGEVAFEE
jgi:hypothetical protein